MIVSQKPRPRVGKGKSAGSLEESEASGPENTSVGGIWLVFVWKPMR